MNVAVIKNFLRVTFFSIIATLNLLPAQVLAATVGDASKYVENIGNKAVEIISNKEFTKSTKNEKIERLFRENVDIPWVGRFVVGHFWRQASDEQKKKYLKEYETFLVQNYAVRFTDYTGGSFQITGGHDNGDDEFTVNMEIKSGEAGGKPVLVDYHVRKNDKSKFVIFDIIIEGVSMITTQRSEFTSVITNKGMDYLITQLSNRSSELVPQPKNNP